MFVAVMLVLVTVGTVLFHLLSPWYFTPIASNWSAMDTTIDITFWVTGAVFVAVIFFTAYCAYKYKYDANRRSEYEPENKKLEAWLITLTTLGVIVMLAPGLFAWNEFVTVPKGAAKVEVFAKQWGWAYRFPGADGVLGKSGVKLISDNNPFGIDPKDPKGQDDILINDSEMHLPLNKPVHLLFRSVDVLHNFFVPQFRAKMDIIPGTVTYYWFTPTRTGSFDALCFELCGTGHYNMRGKVVVEEEDAFKAWLAKQPTFAKSMAKAGTAAEKGFAKLDSELAKPGNKNSKRVF
ncbi:MAG: cytochrome c oxidase subunit II [Proteobacteria bacterium]|nr:cytochrome c oxidase subunit II [Pseudomonadota bacterium]